MRPLPATAPPPRRAAGFTLIELMIAVTVMAILASIAYPSYRDHVRRSHRAAAQAFLMDLSLRQQQRLLDVRSYGSTLDDLRASLPPEIAPYYGVTITVGAGAVPTFEVSAAPRGAQAGDGCGTLRLDSAGTKLPEGCW